MLKIVIIILFVATAVGFGQTKSVRLYPKDGRVAVSGTFRPKLATERDVYSVYLRKFQEVSIKVLSNSVFIGSHNECGMHFRLYDDKNVETKIGDAPAGVDDWSGYVEKAGIYKISVEMGCLEAVTARQLTATKPKFEYTLKIYQPPAPSR